jgi:hypothetical protein
METNNDEKPAVAPSDLTDVLGAWLPIKTVPKDYNNPVDLWHVSGFRIADARWSQKRSQWVNQSGDYEDIDVTHWMPLPEAPN